MPTQKEGPRWERFGFRQDLWAWLGGLVVFAVVGSTRFLIGKIYGQSQVIRFLEAMEDPALFFGSALATSSTTSLALMLTLLGFTHRLEAEFDDEFFQRIYRIGLYSTFTLFGSVFLIVLFVFPLGEYEALPDSWYPGLYTGVVMTVAGLASLIFVTVVLLFSTIRRIIETLHTGGSGSR